MNYLLYFAAGGCDKSGGFLGLSPWWKYLPTSNFRDGTCDIIRFDFLMQGVGGQKPSPDIALVLLAIIDDLLRIAGLVAVGFVIYGAIKLITSQGEPDATANARTTIINALIGVAIAIVAVGFVSFVGRKLGN